MHHHHENTVWKPGESIFNMYVVYCRLIVHIWKSTKEQAMMSSVIFEAFLQNRRDSAIERHCIRVERPYYSFYT